MDALRKADVEFEIVPGITSALASAAAAKISLTHRGKASAVIFLTGHQANAEEQIEWQSYVSSGATLAIYMPGFNYRQTANQLVSAGLKSETPCAIISRASSQEQQIYRTTVADLAHAPRLAAPTLLLVGEVVGTAEFAANAQEFEGWERSGAALPQLPAYGSVVDGQFVGGD
jgi:uroporphyrin-III C-methyltransferase/precorrin-2 dehydrogenase/sirohydrochlorin ferrochelatase